MEGGIVEVADAGELGDIETRFGRMLEIQFDRKGARWGLKGDVRKLTTTRRHTVVIYTTLCSKVLTRNNYEKKVKIKSYFPTQL